MDRAGKLNRLVQASKTREGQIRVAEPNGATAPPVGMEPVAPAEPVQPAVEPEPRSAPEPEGQPQGEDVLLKRLAERRGHSVEVFGRRVRVVGEEDKQVQLTGWVPNSFREAVQSWAGELGMTQGEFILEACSRLMADLQEQSERLG